MTHSKATSVFSESLLGDGPVMFSVPGPLSAFALEVLGTCQIPFDQADRGVMLLLDRSKGNLVVIGEFGVYGAKIVGRVMDGRTGALADVVDNRRTVEVGDAEAAQSAGPGNPVSTAFSAQRIALAPIADDESCLGVLALLCGTEADFPDADLSRLTRKAKFSCRDLRSILSRIDVSSWYHEVSEHLAPSSLTERDMHVLLKAFGHEVKTENSEIARVLTADVGEAVRGLGLRAGDHAVGGVTRYSPDQVQTVLRAFGVEITVGRGGVCDLLTMDVSELVRGRSGPEEAEGPPGCD